MHRSWCAEHAGVDSNERLEFLGDAVLGVIVAEHVYRSYPELSEGWLSRARSAVVRESALAEMAGELGVGPCLELGKGEDSSGGRAKPSILADAMEAVIGAVYLDGGYDPARTLVLDHLGHRIAALPGGFGEQDDKSRLQELAAGRGMEPPLYEFDESGPEHDKWFIATVVLGGRTLGRGEGPSKKQAEQAAARQAWERLLPELGPTTGSEISDA
ncbi:ribonuclease III [soil metagenome]